MNKQSPLVLTELVDPVNGKFDTLASPSTSGHYATELHRPPPETYSKTYVPDIRLPWTNVRANVLGTKVFEISSKNAVDVVFSATCGLLPLSNRTVGEGWDATTAAACLAALGKPKTRAWIENHFRWVVWKLAALSRRFGVSRLTFGNVVLHLKKRHEFEVGHTSSRWGLEAICNHTQNIRAVVLVVAQIYGGNGRGEILAELSDGWYSARGVFDIELSCRCTSGQVRTGTKLALQGVRKLLDVIVKGSTLQLDFNGTRLARSAAKLGLKGSSTRMVLPLSCLSAGGGLIPAFDAVVQRIRLLPQTDRLQMQVVLWLVARRGASGRLSCCHSVYARLREGDSVRFHNIIALPGYNGRLLLRPTCCSHYHILRSPAPRRLAAASQYIPRSFSNGARLAALGRDASNAGLRVDALGLVATYTRRTLVLCDASPNLILVTLRRDISSYIRHWAVGLEPGSQVAILHAVLFKTQNHSAALSCDELVLFCPSAQAVLKASPNGSTQGLQDEWNALGRWSRTPMAAIVLSEVHVESSEGAKEITSLVALLADSPNGISCSDLELTGDIAGVKILLSVGDLYYSNQKYYLL